MQVHHPWVKLDSRYRSHGKELLTLLYSAQPDVVGGVLLRLQQRGDTRQGLQEVLALDHE